MTNRTEYRTNFPERNGLNGRFAQVNFAGGWQTRLRVQVFPSCAKKRSCRACEGEGLSDAEVLFIDRAAHSAPLPHRAPSPRCAADLVRRVWLQARECYSRDGGCSCYAKTCKVPGRAAHGALPYRAPPTRCTAESVHHV